MPGILFGTSLAVTLRVAGEPTPPPAVKRPLNVPSDTLAKVISPFAKTNALGFEPSMTTSPST